MTKRDANLLARSPEDFDISRIEEQVARIPLSPLGELIARMLPAVPEGRMRSILERIKNLKQGRFDDLEQPEFQSFLISYLRIDLATLRAMTQMLRTEYSVAFCSDTSPTLELAARGADTASALTNEELEILLSRRRFAD